MKTAFVNLMSSPRAGQSLLACLLVIGLQPSGLAAGKLKPNAQLEQGVNGGVNRTVINPVNWVTGSANLEKAHLQTGQSIPYRIVLTGLLAGQSGSIIIGYDNVVGGRHGLDFLTSNDRISEMVNPLQGTGLTGSAATPDSSFTIPAPPAQPMTASFMAQLPESQLQMKMWGGTIGAIKYVTQGNELSSGNQTTQVQVSFTATAASAVLSWGGHIARDQDWGPGAGADSIPGSPYHTYLGGLSFPANNKVVTGSQDLQLAALPGTPPDCALSGPSRGCAGQLLSFSTTITGTGLQWSLANNQSGATFPDGSATTGSTVQVKAGTSAGSVDVVLMVIGTTGTTSCKQTVTVDAGPTVDVATVSGCQGTGTLSATVSTSTATPFSYAWTGPAGTGPFDNAATITVSTPGDYSVTVTDANGCSGTGSGTIGIHAGLGVTVNGGVACDNVAATLTAAVTGSTAMPFTFAWTGPDGTGPFDTTDTITATLPGSYTVSVTDQNGCGGSFTTTVANCAPCPSRSSSYWFSSVVTSRGTRPPEVLCATLQAVFDAQPNQVMDLGFLQVNLNQALGLFWLMQDKTGDGQRSGVCSARKTLSVELIAAIANSLYINVGAACQVPDPSSGGFIPVADLIAQAKALLNASAGLDCTNPDAWIGAMNALRDLLATFNEAGSSLEFPVNRVSCAVGGTANFNYIQANAVDPTTSANCACAAVVP